MCLYRLVAYIILFKGYFSTLVMNRRILLYDRYYNFITKKCVYTDFKVVMRDNNPYGD